MARFGEDGEAARALDVLRSAVYGRYKITWVAEQVACSHPHLSRILSGQARLTPARARALARVLQLPPEQVLPATSARPRRRPSTQGAA